MFKRGVLLVYVVAEIRVASTAVRAVRLLAGIASPARAVSSQDRPSGHADPSPLVPDLRWVEIAMPQLS